MDTLFEQWRDMVRAETAVALVTEITGDSVGAKLVVPLDGAYLGSLGHTELDAVAARDAREALSTNESGTRNYGARGEIGRSDVTLFFEPYLPRPRLVIFGAVDFAAALATAAGSLGFRVTVCDPRSTFATGERFPMAAEVIAEWPHVYLDRVGDTLTDRDAVCVLTHDERLDVPAIAAALATDVGYIGAMGSRRTHERRTQRLREAGISGDELADRLMAPIGIDIGARTPEEVAVSICAEIIAVHNKHPAPHLRDRTGPIHGRRRAEV